MQEKYVKSKAMNALSVFMTFMQQENKKQYLEGSNRSLLFLTIIAYQGECSNFFLNKAIPVKNRTKAIKDLEKNNLISINKQNNKYTVSSLTQEALDLCKEVDEAVNQVTPKQLWLFANTLHNLSVYIKEYKINAYNVLALILESTLHVDSSLNMTLPVHEIKTIDASPAQRYSIRKKLLDYGVIKPVSSGKGSISTFKMNRNAYLMEYKK